MLSPEIAGFVASGIGLLGLVLSKARCFVRRVAGIWDCGFGFCDSTLLPRKSCVQVNPCSPPPGLLAPSSKSTCNEAPKSWARSKRE